MSTIKSLFRRIAGGAPQGDPHMLEVGTQAPGFSATAHDGSNISLSDYRGKKVILWFYPKADTPG